MFSTSELAVGSCVNLFSKPKPADYDENNLISKLTSVTQHGYKENKYSDRISNVQIALDHFNNSIKPTVLAKGQADKEKALNHLEKIFNSAGEELGQILEKLERAITLAPATVNVSSKSLPSFQGEVLLNKRETRKERVSYNRRCIEDTLFYMGGMPSNSDPYFRYTATAPGSTPTYGSLAFHTKLGGATLFGDTAFYLKPHVKENMTFTARDSGYLGNLTLGESELIRDYIAVSGNIYPVIAKAGKKEIFEIYNQESITEPEMYIEWQSHGPINFKTDVKHIYSNQDKNEVDLVAISTFAQNHTFTKVSDYSWIRDE